MKTIIAATRRQAEHVARQLGLNPLEWSYGYCTRNLEGRRAADLIYVRPWLGSHDPDLEAHLGAIAARDGVEIQEVWT